jgi:glucan phosphorylase
LRQANGDLLRFEIAWLGFSVWLRAWQVRVGRAKLYLLDSNDDANSQDLRGITGAAMSLSSVTVISNALRLRKVKL